MDTLLRIQPIIVSLMLMASFSLFPSDVVFAETPTPIVITIEENITIADDDKNSPGSNIEESIGVIDEVSTAGQLIQEAISINDDVKTEVSGGIPATATPQPTATMRPTATMKPVPPKKTPKTNTRAPILFSPGSKTGPAITPTPQATNKYGRAPVVTSKSSRQPVAVAPPKQPEQKTSVRSNTPTRRTFGNFFGFRSSSSKDDDKKTTTSRSSSSRSRFSLVGRATGEDETQSEEQGDMAEESTGGSCASTSAREGVSVLAMLMLPLVIVNRKRLGL